MAGVRKQWRQVVCVAFVVAMAACSSVEHRLPPAPANPVPPSAIGQPARGALREARAVDGPTVARHLQERYDDSKADCQGLPVILCSGILLRATVRGAGYYVWNPRPTAPIKKGVSFSWLRKDSAFSRLVFGYSNGFFVLPYFYADDPSDGFTQLTVLCIYPFDADTFNRTGGNNDGCGAHTAVAGTGPCQAQGIQTAAQWMGRFGNVANRHTQQCGFTLLPGTSGAYLAFQAQAVIRAQQPTYFPLQNEVMVGTWPQNDSHLPLEAFFYIVGNGAGKTEAGQNQVDFKAQTGRWVPVIRVSLPTTNGGAATFAYVEADQQAK